MRSLVMVTSLMAAGWMGYSDEAASPPATPVETFVMDARREPVPAFQYRLLPPLTDLRPGNAAPLYLRPRHEKHDEWNKHLIEECQRLLTVPRGELKADEVDKLLESYAYVLSQLEVGARRETCDWEYPYGEDGQDPLEFRLPDITQMRLYGRLLAVKIRGDVQAGRFDDAVHTLQTGLAFARHVANAPFLVNRLTGVAIAELLLDEVQEFITQPGAPNLYWALASLPRPLIDVRGSLDFERELLLYKFPELRDLERPRSEEEWSRLESQMRSTAEQMRQELESFEWSTLWDSAEKPSVDEARAFLIDQAGFSPERVKGMSEGEVTVRYTVLVYYYFYDGVAKAAYLPHLANEPAALGQQLAKGRVKEMIPLAQFFVPGIEQAVKAQLKLDRRLDALQAVGALGLYAAGHEGKLPAALAELEPAAPKNPVGGGEFEYRLNSDGIAELKASPMAKMNYRAGLDWRIQVRPAASK
ncbi:MAG: hypothetical protein KF708_06235 [Pirellulales bacterium]|nr:hypothetical protein [Pirellulales bacterium]